MVSHWFLGKARFHRDATRASLGLRELSRWDSTPAAAPSPVHSNCSLFSKLGSIYLIFYITLNILKAGGRTLPLKKEKKYLKKLEPLFLSLLFYPLSLLRICRFLRLKTISWFFSLFHAAHRVEVEVQNYSTAEQLKAEATLVLISSNLLFCYNILHRGTTILCVNTSKTKDCST